MNKSDIQRDWESNRCSIKSLIIVLFFRLSSWIAQNNNFTIRTIGIPIRITYKILTEFVMGVELPDRVIAGPGLRVFHGVGLVVNSRTILGNDVTLRQNTTIGSKTDGGQAPSIGDGVSVGANCVILGGIYVGAFSQIGAGAILTRDCPPHSVVYGAKSDIKIIADEGEDPSA